MTMELLVSLKVFVAIITDLIHADLIYANLCHLLLEGRFITPTARYLGVLRLGTPIVLLWIYALAHNQGITAWILSRKVFTVLSPYTYHLYLLHVPMSKYIWLAFNGAKFKFWWPIVPGYPVPLNWWIFLLTVVICLFLGWFIEKYLVTTLQPYTIQWGVSICRLISNFLSQFVSVGGNIVPSSSHTATFAMETESLLRSSSRNERDWKKEEVLSKIEGIVGVKVSLSTPLRDLGLDSLGGTALLNALKSTISGAQKLTLVQLTQEYETVDDLVQSFLNARTDNDGAEKEEYVRRGMVVNNDSSTEGDNTNTQSQAWHIILTKIEGVTGVPVELSTSLKDLGLDSLGGTALLGALKSTIPEAKDLTLSQLVDECESVGDLVHLLFKEGV